MFKVSNKIKELIALSWGFIPQLDWQNGDKVIECRKYAKENILELTDYTEEEQEEILNYVFPIR